MPKPITPRVMQSIHDITEEFEGLTDEGIYRVYLDMMTEGNSVTIGGRYDLPDGEILVIYLKKPRRLAT